MPKVDKFPRRHLLVYAYCLAADLVCWLIVLTLWIFAGKGAVLLVQNGLWVAIPRTSLLAKTIFNGIGGGTMGHGGWYLRDLIGKDGIDTALEFHEHIHVEQFESIMLAVSNILLGFVVNLGIRGQLYDIWPMVLFYWALGGLIGVFSNWVVALLRGEEAYRGSAHEEAAYALEKEFKKKKG